MWQQKLSSNCSFGHVRGLAKVLLCLRIKNIYMGQWTGMAKAFAWALQLTWCCMYA